MTSERGPKLKAADAYARLEGIFNSIGIDVTILGHFDLEFPDGATFSGHLAVGANGISHQRG